MTTPRLVLPFLLLLAACGGNGDAAGFPGTIEVDESDAAPLVAGRVVELRFHEGDTVTAGDTVALLARGTIPALYEERRARLAAARARLADLERGSRTAELERAEADLAALEAEAERAASDLARAERLARDKVIAPQELDRARAAAQSAARRRDAARATLELVREGTRTDQIRQARAEVASAEAQLEAARADVGELAVLAAVSGVVLGRHADPGEVVAAGTPLLTIGVVARPWVRVYLPAHLISRLPARAPAEVVMTRAGAGEAAGPPLAARLASVRPNAEFTPRAALTEEERADLLFAARVEIIDPPATARPGLPVTVRFTTDSGGATQP
jgi:HlyD family secretion protein